MNFAFRLGSIPVRVHGSFLLMLALLGYGGGDPRGLIQWIVVAFVAVLLHELGHALVGKSYGLSPQIDLVGFGGLTSWSGGNVRALGAGRRIAISFAGPMVGIVIGAAAHYFLEPQPMSPAAKNLVLDVVWVNLGWGVMNLLPILPMDGGNILFQVLNVFTKGRGETPARVVSVVLAVVAGLLALVAFGKGAAWIILLAAMFAAQNVQALRARGARERDTPLRGVLVAGFKALEAGDMPGAVRAAHEVLSANASPALQADAIRLLAFTHLQSGAWGPLMDLMESPASNAIGDDELAKFEQAARELGRPDEATRIGAVRAARRQATAF